MSRCVLRSVDKPITRRRGTALIEMAIVLPFLMLVVFGIIEFGSVMYTRHNMTQAAREAARVLAIRDGTTAQAVAVAQSRLANVAGVNFTVNCTVPAEGAADQDVVVEITAPLSEAALADPMKIMGNGVVRARAIMRKET